MMLLCRHGWDLESCALCKLPLRPIKPPRRRTVAPIKVAPSKPANLCLHLGPERRPRQDPNGVECLCAGKTVRQCDLYGRCTLATKYDGVACCAVGTPGQCHEYDDGRMDIAEWTRHLIYHIYPVAGNGGWQRNVASLCERLRIFNGKMIVTIVVDPPEGRKADPIGPTGPKGTRSIAGCDSYETVKAAFGPWRDKIEFIESINDPEQREGATLIPMLERLPGGPADVVLYAQAKGVTYAPGHISEKWTETLIIVYLDYWPLVAEQLKTYPITGAFQKFGRGWATHESDWHYSGSWFWARTADIFARDWRTIDDGWSAIEPWPSQKFSPAEAGCLFMSDKQSVLKLYRPSYWRKTVDPLFVKWRRDNVKYFNGTQGI